MLNKLFDYQFSFKEEADCFIAKKMLLHEMKLQTSNPKLSDLTGNYYIEVYADSETISKFDISKVIESSGVLLENKWI